MVAPSQQQMDEDFLFVVRAELGKARQKFPSENLSFVVLLEELDDLAEAILKHRAGLLPYKEVVREAAQVAAMVIRVVNEVDASLLVDYKEMGYEK